MIYEHPPAYLLGLESIALMRSFRGEHGHARGRVDHRDPALIDDQGLALEIVT